MKREIISKSLEQTKEFAHDLVEQCLGLAPRNEALVLGLEGDLGSGKTAFVQNFAKAFGVEDNVVSPTFVILKRYTLKKSRYKNLIHIDAYRVKKEEELKVLGWDDFINDPCNIVLIEWSENVKSFLPKNYIQILFEHVGENERKITIRNLGQKNNAK